MRTNLKPVTYQPVQELLSQDSLGPYRLQMVQKGISVKDFDFTPYIGQPKNQIQMAINAMKLAALREKNKNKGGNICQNKTSQDKSDSMTTRNTQRTLH